MNLHSLHTQFLLPPPATLHKRHLPSVRHGGAWKRRRLKPPLTLRYHLNNSFDFPNPSDLILPALCLASGLTLYLSSKTHIPINKNDNSSSKPKLKNSDVGEWILFTSPTPFNRFVTLRCPSIYFPGSELLEDVNEKLVEEGRHFVRLNSGRMLVDGGEINDVEEVDVVYQRVCVGTEDGGVISLDWPEDLDMDEERGLDTTVLIVPGTPEGSNERKIKGLVRESLRRGVFPVVMNPRGCASSPLTTPRLFTAADSDDISTAIQYINKARPWTTFMAIGCGYGANMLTKYLAEAGENTPLTAATCIDNPFDLEEATRSSACNFDFDQKLTRGFVDMLQCNKELFQGRGKGFDVDKALSASSIREFEKAISMVSYGFDTLEEFYTKSSTRDVVSKVKIPVLFVQNDDGSVPLFSIPRSAIAENPYTSLLLCSYSASSENMNDRSAFSWCQHVPIEWLTAVELGLLKGRHPLLDDFDVTINASKGLDLVERRTSSRGPTTNNLLTISDAEPEDQFSLNRLLGSQDNDTTGSTRSMSGQDSRGLILRGENDDVEYYGIASYAESIEEDAMNAVETESHQVLQTAQVVMNMLDVTMPGTLSVVQKKKVLSAVDRGETLMQALHDAVPEDVRGKLKNAVSGILQSQGSNLKLNRLLSLENVPDLAAGLNSTKVLETMKISKSAGDKDVQPPDGEKRTDDAGDGSGKVPLIPENPSAGPESESRSSESSKRLIGTGQVHSVDIQESDKPGSDKVEQGVLGNQHENGHLSRSNTSQPLDDKETVSQTIDMPEVFYESKELVGSEDIAVKQKNVEKENDRNQMKLAEENYKEKDNLSTDQTKMTESSETEDKSSTPSVSSDTQVTEKEVENNQKKEEKFEQPVSTPKGSPGSDMYQAIDQKEEKLSTSSSASENQVMEKAENDQKKEERNGQPVSTQSGSPSFSVSQALDALTGFDDSTQVAVNSVFHVIEDMIDQLKVDQDGKNQAESRDDESDINGNDEPKKPKELSLPENCLDKDEPGLEKKGNDKNDSSVSSGISTDDHLYSPAGSVEESKCIVSCGDRSNSSQTSDVKNKLGEENENCTLSAPEEKLLQNLNESLNSSTQGVPNKLTSFPYTDPLSKEYLKAYLVSMMSSKPQYLDATSALYLDFSPEEGQWKLLKQSEEDNASVGEFTTHESHDKENQMDSHSELRNTYDVIEPSYTIIDAQDQQSQYEGGKRNKSSNGIKTGVGELNESMIFIKRILLESLNVEVSRRVNAADVQELGSKLANEIEVVANAISLAVTSGEVHDHTSEKYSTLRGNKVVRVISSAVRDTKYLKRVLPVGVIVGSSLAALRKYFDMAAVDGIDENEDMFFDPDDKTKNSRIELFEQDTKKILTKKVLVNDSVNCYAKIGEEDIKSRNTDNEVVVGAVTAALGASAFLAQQNTETAATLSEDFKGEENSRDSPALENKVPEKTENNIVTSLAEKAMSVASPIVPTKADGEVDHERLVSMLAEWGQKGGILRLVGKVALLWGGMRGAMSLTDKLISFLRIAERPLAHRIVGFVFMVLLLWSPIVVPLLPSLMQSWGSGQPFKVAEVACIFGLYVSLVIMVILWGKRIRKYEDPLAQYGIDLTSLPKFRNFLIGLVGGTVLVLLIYSLNSTLGFVRFCWPATFSTPSSDPVTLFKVYGLRLVLTVQGLATATSIAVVEELLFRSWLPQEIAADLGYHRGIIISGLAFSLFQRSTWEIPGLWFLSLSLSGAREISQGSLSFPIGLRAGILASSYFLKTGGFLNRQPNFPLWLAGSNPFQPFSGIVGLAFSLVLAIVLYPRQSLKTKTKGVIRE